LALSLLFFSFPNDKKSLKLETLFLHPFSSYSLANLFLERALPIVPCFRKSKTYKKESFQWSEAEKSLADSRSRAIGLTNTNNRIHRKAKPCALYGKSKTQLLGDC